MKRATVSMLVMVLLSLTVLAGQAMAAPGGEKPHLNWGSQVNPAECPAGKQVINVTFKVLNDLDDGVKGNYWARSNYNKTIKVWQTGNNTFCADVRYIGSFSTLAGNSPGGTAVNPAGITGTFQGGYLATFTASAKPDPSYRSNGNLGTFDYHDRTTPFDWLGAYFVSSDDFADFSQPWWGWIYHAGKNGTWGNASTSNQGDITGP